MATSYLDDFGDDVFDALAKYGVKNNPNDYIPGLDEQSHLTPAFGLDYISLEQGRFCFDNPNIPKVDFIELLKCCNRMSALSYSDIGDKSVGNAYHFHEVDKRKLRARGLLDKFQHKLDGRTRGLPPVYQFALYTDSGRGTAPRVLGYIGKWGIFFLLWFDWGHEIYSDIPHVTPVVAPPVADAPSASNTTEKPRRPRFLRPKE
jgi:hypothetical protein